mmetsp:Transcript_20499/g.52560  ORF Transcript_20499/g.52560 Transcript_20499/m.52560 type:complete len:213 (-) Transcript_20499:434-1072(-)
MLHVCARFPGVRAHALHALQAVEQHVEGPEVLGEEVDDHFGVAEDHFQVHQHPLVTPQPRQLLMQSIHRRIRLPPRGALEDLVQQPKEKFQQVVLLRQPQRHRWNTEQLHRQAVQSGAEVCVDDRLAHECWVVGAQASRELVLEGRLVQHEHEQCGQVRQARVPQVPHSVQQPRQQRAFPPFARRVPHSLLGLQVTTLRQSPEQLHAHAPGA